MSLDNTDKTRLLYMRYKMVGREKNAILDPEGQLSHRSRSDAKRLIPILVQSLSKKQIDTVKTLTTKEITLREECAEHYASRPRQSQVSRMSQRFHRIYVQFLKYTKKQLSEYKSDRETLVAVKEQDLAVNEIKQLEKEAQPSEEDLHQANEARSEDDEEPNDNKEADDDEGALTLAQAEFFAFLEIIIALVEEAAALWTEVRQDELPIWVAAILSGILLREAESLVNVAELLGKESRKGERKSEAPVPWAAATTSKDRGYTPKPQLTQDWVDALDKVVNAGTLWCELTKHLPKFEYFLDSFICSCKPPSCILPPYLYLMLYADFKALKDVISPSPAQVPFVTLVGVYFCALIVKDLGVDETTTSLRDHKFVSATRDAACAIIEENLAILPRLIDATSLTDKQASDYRKSATEIKAWAHACAEPVSLGQIFSFAQIQWIWMHTVLTASNSLPLQAFLYLYEERRLDALETKRGGGGNDNDNRDDEYEYERLLGALMEDPRVAPFLLQNGRPTTPQQCNQMLAKWCFIPSADDEKSDLLKYSAESSTRSRMMEVITKRSERWRKDLLSVGIEANNYGLTKEMRDRLSPIEDGNTVRRYLIWEASPPSCLKLEAALFKALRHLPQWQEMRLSALREHLARTKWLQAVANVINSGLDVLLNASNRKTAYGLWELSPSRENAILKLALKLPGHEESLKAAFAEMFSTLVAQWEGSFADEFLRATMLGWQTTFIEFNIVSLSRSYLIEALASMYCMLPLKVDKNKENNQGRNKRKNKRPYQKLPPWSDVVGDFLTDFMVEAGPTLEATYGVSKSLGTSTGDIESMMGRTTV